MRVEIISYPLGDQLPVLLDENGLPIPAPNEFVIGRRWLSTNTLTRNLNELGILHKWFDSLDINPLERIAAGIGFTEAEIRGSCIEFLRRGRSRTAITKINVSPSTFNQRLTTARQYISWLFEVYLGAMLHSDLRYEHIRNQKKTTMFWLDSAFINAPPANKSSQKGLTQKQVNHLINALDPNLPQTFGRDLSVRFRNYVSIMIMLLYGLRPGELLSLRVEDIEFCGISSINITRRTDDPKDPRQPRPHIKRNGRVLPIDNDKFARQLNSYIMQWRDQLETKSAIESDYLILSDEGKPLSQASLTQLFQILRKKYPEDLPSNLTAKSLRHTFSSNLERELRVAGVDEKRRTEILAELRGDSSLDSQNTYIRQEVEEMAKQAMSRYHKKLIS